MTSIRRRQVIAGLAMAPFIFRYPLASKILGRLVIIGGGFAGATLARFAKALEPRLGVTLIEARARYIACPMSNLVLAGERELNQQTFDYKALAEAGVQVIKGYAVDVDGAQQRVMLTLVRLALDIQYGSVYKVLLSCTVARVKNTCHQSAHHNVPKHALSAFVLLLCDTEGSRRRRYLHVVHETVYVA